MKRPAQGISWASKRKPDTMNFKQLSPLIVSAFLSASGNAAASGLLGNLVLASLSRSAAAHWHKSAQDSQEAPQVAATLPPPSRDFRGCRDMFYQGWVPKVPGENALRTYALCAKGYAVIYSGVTKTPLVVAERLSRDRMSDAAGEKRPDSEGGNAFFADPRIPATDRAQLSDYEHSRFDRGHMAPAADQADPESMNQSFALTNIVPQSPVNNRKVWSKIESAVRKFARRARGDVYVYTGPIFSGDSRTIGTGRVRVPTHLFKVVVDASSGRTWAYLLPNTDDAQVEAPMDYPSFESKTGLHLLPG